MKILYLTGGAGQMYCGSCLRDNSLATELLARDHDVILLPVYTPTRTDEPNVSNDKVFFGGISVYLEQYVPLFRKTPRWLDRVWDSGPMLKLASKRSISTSPKMLGELTVSMLKGEGGFQRKEIEKMLDWLKSEPLPDVISLPYTLLISLAKPIKELLNRPICCTLQGEDLFLDGLLEPYRSESMALIQKNLEHVDAFIAVSQYYADFMADYLKIPAAKIHLVPLGINLEGFDRPAQRQTQPFTVGYFARIAPEKGLHNLVEAYKLMRQEVPEARLEVAGYIAPEFQTYLRDCERVLATAGLGAEFHYHGALDRDQKIAFLKTIDVLSVPTTYAEPKGLFLLEAMACGVPVVQPRHGAFPEIIEKTGGGLLVDAESPIKLAEGLAKLYREPELAKSLGSSGYERVREFYSVGRMADRALEVYESMTRQAAATGV
ncbi:MAG TPA: glycosyltransferase family 4 protein [Pyrinomonadaceae bacterium]|nr:glycosyltransferase family 4 protein [Pyrinomonadaceae bacterium]